VQWPDNLDPKVSILIERFMELTFVSWRHTIVGLADSVVSLANSLWAASFSPLTFHDMMDRSSFIGKLIKLHHHSMEHWPKTHTIQDGSSRTWLSWATHPSLTYYIS
jgi:hypothetical protein